MAALEIDPSIILKAKPPEFDPLAMVGKFQEAQKGILGNRLLGQEIGGKEALGRAVTGATDPNTGKTDWNRALGSLSQDPRGAFAVPQLAGDVLDRQIKQLQLDGADLDLTAKRATKITDVTGALLASKEPLTRDEVIKTLSDGLVGSGMFNDEKAIHQLTSFVQNLPGDDKGLRSYIEKAYLGYGPLAERLAALKGNVTAVNVGPTTELVQSSPLTSSTQGVGSLKMGLSPESATAPTPMMVRNPDGSFSPSTVTRQQFSELAQQGPVATAPPLSREGLTPEMLNQQVKIIDPVTKQEKVVTLGSILPQMGGGGVATSLAPGQAAAAGAAAEGAAKQFNDLRSAAERVPESSGALRNIRDTLETFTPGPKANWGYAINALATQMGVASPQQVEGAAGQEEFNKLATQFINQQVGALGGTGTDAKLESARHGSPNEFMSTLGIRNVTGLMLGLNDALAAKNLAAQKWMDAGNGPESYGKFVSEFNKYYNPRVFQSTYMTEAQKAAMMKGMSAKEREDFKKDWVRAKQFGWIK